MEFTTITDELYNDMREAEKHLL